MTRPFGSAVRGTGLVGLVVVAAVALNSTPGQLPAATTSSLRGSRAGVPTVVVLTLSSVAGAVIMLWAWRRLRRSHHRGQDPDPELTPTWNPTRRSQLVGLLLGLAVLTGPWLLLLASTRAPRALSSPRILPLLPPAPGAHWAASPISPDGTAIALVSALGLVLLALVAGYLARRRQQATDGPAEAPSRTPDHPEPAPPPSRLASSASWTASGGNRARVIAAYTTMRAASRRDLATDATETPDEFLDRLCSRDAHLVDDGTIITTLFQQARFSELKLQGQDVRSAEVALHAVLSILRSRR